MNKRTITAAALAAGLLVQTEGFTEVGSIAISAAATASVISAVDTASPPQLTGAFPGQVALDAGYPFSPFYVTARDGGGQTVDALITSATTIGPNERFTVEQVGDYLSFKTANGDYVSMTDGLSNATATQVAQTVLTAPADTTLFSTVESGFNYYHLVSYYDEYVSIYPGKSTAAIGESAYPSESGIRGIAPQQCGDLGSGYSYSIVMETGSVFNSPLAAHAGFTKGALVEVAYSDLGFEPDAQFTLIRQDDGSYALQTAKDTLDDNEINYVTAVNGGGLAHGTDDSDNLITTATQVGAWEKFRISDQGNCTYTIQTSSGYYVAYKLQDQPGFATEFLSTRISDPAAAPSIGYGAYFVLRPLWNN